ncbi:MAG: hypothetical protein IKA74_00220 [Clostridia bacterium]|nr:hypothetical protein [Clostridia bacterium]
MKKFTRILSLALVMVMAVCALASCSDTVDYESDDLGEYITLSDADLRNIALSLTQRGKTADEYINDLLFANRKYTKNTDEEAVIGMGDMVDIYYYVTVDGEDYIDALDGMAGYNYDSSGNPVPVYASGTNMPQSTPSSVYLGANTVSELLEKKLGSGDYKLGDFKDTKREIKTEGTVAVGDIVYVTYTESYKTNNTTTKSDTYSYKRIVVPAEGEYSELVGKEIGKTFEFKRTKEKAGANREVTYSGTVNFKSTEAFKDIEISFPEDYSIPALKGKTATFHVIVDALYARGGENYVAKKGDISYAFYRGVILSVADEKYNDYVGSLFDSNYGSTVYSVNIGAGNSIADFENGFIGKGVSGSVTGATSTGKIKDVLFDGSGNLKDLKISIMLKAQYSKNDTVVDYIKPYEQFVNTVDAANAETHTGNLRDLTKDLYQPLLDYFKTCDVDLQGTFAQDFELEIDGAVRNVAVEGYIRLAAEDVDDAVYIDAVFPDDYNSSQPHLNGATARFYIVVDHITPCEIPALDEDFIKNTVKYESDKTGDELINAFKDYTREYLEASQRSEDINEASSQIWAHLFDKAMVIEYPDGNVEDEVDKVYEEIKATYNSYRSQYGTSFTQTYPSLNSYIQASAIESGAEKDRDTDYYLEFVAQSRIKEKMILFSAVKTLGIVPSDEDYQKYRTQFINEMASYYGTTAEEIEKGYEEIDIRMQILSNLLIEKLYDVNVGNITRK